MKITLQQVEAFFWAARLGSFHAAARHLNFTQPAISARIKELESLLQMQLFERSNQRVELTPEGRHALIYAERVLSAGQAMEGLRRSTPLHGVLRLGANESSALMGLTDILAGLRAMYPDLQIEVTIDLSATLRRKLGRRELDLAIHSFPGEKPPAHVIEHVLGWVAFHWVASARLDIGAGPFTPAHAVAHPIVTNAQPSTLSSLVRNWLQAGGCDFNVYNACNSLALMLRLVESDGAIAVAPASAIREGVEAGTLRILPAEPAIPLVGFGLYYLAENRSDNLTRIIALVREVLTGAGYFAQPAEHGA